MGWDEIERSWNELKGEVKRQWSKLTDEDVELIKGKYAELLSLLQERYGQAKEQAEREINDWARRLPKPRILHPYPDKRFAVTHPRLEACAGIPPHGSVRGDGQ
jgi:uncharacterized protein YjbJ (UPF0337 family)